MYAQPSKSASSGVAIYVDNKLDHFRNKNDLSVIQDDFESLWTEIKNNKGKNAWLYL